MIRYERLAKGNKYKYVLIECYSVDVYLYGFSISTPFMVLRQDGWMIIRNDYAWDGPSGPTIDTENFMRGSLVHDALYQLMREGKLPVEYRKHADKTLRRLCIQDGMSRFRAWYVYQSVRLFAGGCVK